MLDFSTMSTPSPRNPLSFDGVKEPSVVEALVEPQDVVVQDAADALLDAVRGAVGAHPRPQPPRVHAHLQVGNDH